MIKPTEIYNGEIPANEYDNYQDLLKYNNLTSPIYKYKLFKNYPIKLYKI